MTGWLFAFSLSKEGSTVGCFLASFLPKKWLLIKVPITEATFKFYQRNILVQSGLACENRYFSSLFAAGDISHGGTSATQRHKFHTDDANQCSHNMFGSHGVSHPNLFNFMFPLVDFY